MAFARLLKDLLKNKDFGHRLVPIIPDEARTFGMDAYFPSSKIYNPHGQAYTSVDRELLLAYKESPQGQILHTGINEAGAFAAFTATGTSYATHGEPMVPIYVFYSMFGFQRTGDAMWAAGDQMARGFIMGATAGRTTLTGEGLQHADGHSPLLASTNPAVVTYDPAYSYEIAHIVKAGLERMYGGTHPDPNVMYYLTIYNEPILQPEEPEGLDVEGLLKGLYLLKEGQLEGAPKATILASGVGMAWGAGSSRASRNRLGCQCRCLFRHLVERAPSRRCGGRAPQLPSPRPASTGALCDRKASGSTGAHRRSERLHALGSRPNSRVCAGHLSHVGCRWVWV
jgi:pyruvate dehydrogenase E1 component